MTSADRMMWTIVIVFCAVMVLTFAVLLYGLYDVKVDNRQIFAILNSWGDKIVSALTVILGAKAMGNQGAKP